MEAQKDIRSLINEALNALSSKQVGILQENKAYNNSQLKAGEKQRYYEIDLEKKQLSKMLGELDKLETGFKMYQEISAAKATAEAAAPTVAPAATAAGTKSTDAAKK